MLNRQLPQSRATVFFQAARLEKAGEECLHCRSACGFVLGNLRLLARQPRLPQRDAGPRGNGHQHRRLRCGTGRHRDDDCGAHRGFELVPAHPALGAVPTRIGPRHHGLTAQMAFEVVGQSIDGGVALAAGLGQGAGQDGVEVAFELAPQGRVRGQIRGRIAGARCLGLLDGQGQSHRVQILFQTVGTFTDQQFEQHHAQRIDVGRSAYRFTANLLWRGVIGR